MALYVSAGRRTRRTVIVAVAMVVVGLGVGYAVGRQQVPSIQDRVVTVRASAADVATGIERLDIEYEQAIGGGGDSISAGVLSPLAGDRAQLQTLLDEAPWVVAADRSALLDQLAAVEAGARDKIDLEAFRSRANDAGAKVRSVFGA